MTLKTPQVLGCPRLCALSLRNSESSIRQTMDPNELKYSISSCNTNESQRVTGGQAVYRPSSHFGGTVGGRTATAAPVTA